MESIVGWFLLRVGYFVNIPLDDKETAELTIEDPAGLRLLSKRNWERPAYKLNSFFEIQRKLERKTVLSLVFSPCSIDINRKQFILTWYGAPVRVVRSICIGNRASAMGLLLFSPGFWFHRIAKEISRYGSCLDLKRRAGRVCNL